MNPDENNDNYNYQNNVPEPVSYQPPAPEPVYQPSPTESLYSPSTIPDTSALDASSMPGQNISAFQNFAFLGGLLNLNNINQQQQINHNLNRNVADLTEKVNEHSSQANNLQNENNDLYGEINRLKRQVAQLKSLFEQPLHEIAKIHPEFAKNYFAEKELLASWMVSQKAFRELAIQLGKAQGVTQEEINQKGLAMELDVLTNRNNPNHGTNASEKFFEPYKENLMKQFQPKDKQEVMSRINDIKNASDNNEKPKSRYKF